MSYNKVTKCQVSARLLLPHKAFARQNILQSIITQDRSNAKYLSPKLRADIKLLALHLQNRQIAASVCAVTTTFEHSTTIVAQGAAASYFMRSLR